MAVLMRSAQSSCSSTELPVVLGNRKTKNHAHEADLQRPDKRECLFLIEKEFFAAGGIVNCVHQFRCGELLFDIACSPRFTGCGDELVVLVRRENYDRQSR